MPGLLWDADLETRFEPVFQHAVPPTTLLKASKNRCLNRFDKGEE
jgi:hypothetical protein